MGFAETDRALQKPSGSAAILCYQVVGIAEVVPLVRVICQNMLLDRSFWSRVAAMTLLLLLTAAGIVSDVGGEHSPGLKNLQRLLPAEGRKKCCQLVQLQKQKRCSLQQSRRWSGRLQQKSA